MIRQMIHDIQQQVADFLAKRGHEATGVLGQSYLISGNGAVVGIQSVFPDASATWIFNESEVRIEDKEKLVRMTLEAEVVKRAA